MLLVELVVVVVAVLRAEEFPVGVADDDVAAFARELLDVPVRVQLTGILQCLVVVSESAYNHALQSFDFLRRYGEIPHDEIGEIKLGEFVEQLVLVFERVGVVSHDEREIRVSLRRELACLYRVAVAHHHRASCPDVADVELAAVQFPARFNSVDNHSCEVAHGAFGVFVHHGLHILHASLHVARVEARHTVEEYELVAVCTQREPFLRNLRITLHLPQTVSLESVVCRGI